MTALFYKLCLSLELFIKKNIIFFKLLHLCAISQNGSMTLFSECCELYTQHMYNNTYIIYNFIYTYTYINTHFSWLQFSRSVVSNSLRPHELQHARPPCPSPLPEITQTHVHRVGDVIQPSHPLSSPSPPAPNPSQHQSLFQWVNSSHEVAKVLEFQL